MKQLFSPFKLLINLMSGLKIFLIDQFQKSVWIYSLDRVKGLKYPKEVIVIHLAEEEVAKHIFSDPESIQNIEAGGHIFSTTKIISWLSD